MNRQSDARVAAATAVRRGEFVYAGVDSGERPADSGAVAADVVARLDALLADAGTDLAHVVKLGVYWREGGFASQQQVLDQLAEALAERARPAVTCVPLPSLDGTATLRIDAIAHVAADAPHPSRSGGLFPDAVRSGRFIAVSGQAGPEAGTDYPRQNELAMEHMGEVLAEFGASLDDVVKFNVFYVGEGTAAEWAIGAQARARSFTEPGPAATGVPVSHLGDPERLVVVDALAMLAEDGTRLPRSYSWPDDHWDWPVHMPYKHGGKCGEMVFFGGQVALTPEAAVIDPDDLAKQVVTSMEYIRRVLAGLGATLADVVQLTAFYGGDDAPCAQLEALVAAEEGVDLAALVITPVHLPSLAYEQMLVEIEGVAIVERAETSA